MTITRKHKPRARPTTDDLRSEAAKGADVPLRVALDPDLADVQPVPLPDYPVAALDGPLRDLVDSTVLPSGLVAGGGLAALAICSAPAELSIGGQTVARPGLWVPLLGPVSAGKTPARQYAFARLTEMENASWATYASERRAWKSNRGEVDKPVDHSLLLQDVTIEKLARMLDDNPHRGQVADELASIVSNLGRYSQGGGGERDKWLELWSGQPWRYSRVNGDIDIYIPNPVVTVCGTLQSSPGRLVLLGQDHDGFRPRWLPHATASPAGDWDGTTGTPEVFNKAIEKLYENRERREWTLRGKSLELWQDAGRRWKAESRRPDERPLAAAALLKADAQCLRIALVIAESMNPLEGGSLHAEEMTAAITITDYVMDVWRWLETPEHLSLSRADEELWKAVCAWRDRADAADGGRITKRDLQRNHIGGVRTEEQVEDVLRAYKRYYPEDVRKETRRGPATVWIYGATS